MNDVTILWEWLGVMTGLIAIFAVLVLHVQWQDPPEPQTWIDRILEAEEPSVQSSSPLSSPEPNSANPQS